jgi:hypothetical protein
MSLVFYQLAGQKLITMIIDIRPALLNRNITEIRSKRFSTIKQLKDGYKKLGGAEVVETFNVDLKLTVPQQVKELKLMIKNALRLNTEPKRYNLIASLMFLLLFFYFTTTGLYLVFAQLFRQLIAEGDIEKELLRELM